MTAEPEATPWCTPVEAAAYVRLKTPALLRQAAKDGELKSSRVGREIRFHKKELDAWLESHPYEPRSA